MKFNGTPSPPIPGVIQTYRIVLKGGLHDGKMTICSYAVSQVFMGGERYELNEDGDYVYAPGGLN
jgi:hypothetical protein